MITLRFRRDPDWGSWTQVTIADQEGREADESDIADILVSRCVSAGIDIVQRWDGETWEDYYA